jgi:23S rRNA (guanine745-N1)-methyltransferase
MLTDTVVQALRCPICGAPLQWGKGTLRCGTAHTFDIARQGYVNLLAGQTPAGAETPDMVAARAGLHAAGRLAPITDAVVDAVQTAGGDGLVLDVGAGTGHYLAAVLDALHSHHGVALDNSKAAARWAARSHPRAASVVADVWRGVPLADQSVDVLLNLFAPRNGAEFHRVLRPDGRLVAVTPAAEHLTELIAALGLLRVDPDKDARLDRSLGRWFEPMRERLHTFQLALSRAETGQLVAMGPSAWHTDPAVVAARLADWAEPVAVTMSVTLRTYRPRP